MRCTEFLEAYSEYLDGRMPRREREGHERHVGECRHCRRYDRVVRRGLALYKTMPQVHASPDFGPRLQHRLFHIDDAGRLTTRRHLGSAALVAVASVGFLALAWLPFATRMSVEVELPAVAVDAPTPETARAAPSLFRKGPYVSVDYYWFPMQPALDGSADLFDPERYIAPIEPSASPGLLDADLDGSR